MSVRTSAPWLAGRQCTWWVRVRVRVRVRMRVTVS